MEPKFDEMSAEQLFKHIEDLETAHRNKLKKLRALLRLKDGGEALLAKKPATAKA